MSDSTNRLALAPKLYSARLITKDCYNCATDNSSKTDIEKGLHLLRGLISTIKTQPQLTNLINTLNKCEAFQVVAKKMQHDLSHTGVVAMGSEDVGKYVFNGVYNNNKLSSFFLVSKTQEGTSNSNPGKDWVCMIGECKENKKNQCYIVGNFSNGFAKLLSAKYSC